MLGLSPCWAFFRRGDTCSPPSRSGSNRAHADPFVERFALGLRLTGATVMEELDEAVAPCLQEPITTIYIRHLPYDPSQKDPPTRRPQ
jgi:hypothetical protein